MKSLQALLSHLILTPSLKSSYYYLCFGQEGIGAHRGYVTGLCHMVSGDRPNITIYTLPQDHTVTPNRRCFFTSHVLFLNHEEQQLEASVPVSWTIHPLALSALASARAFPSRWRMCACGNYRPCCPFHLCLHNPA